MNRFIWVGLIILAVIIGGIFLSQNNTNNQNTPQSEIGQGGAPDRDRRVESTTLNPVGGYTGSGTATRMFDGSTFTHTVTATLADPPEGMFYEGWLVRNEPNMEFFSTGRLEKQGDQYSLAFTSDQNQPDFKDVVITLETEAKGLDGVPETHVLEGTFK